MNPFFFACSINEMTWQRGHRRSGTSTSATQAVSTKDGGDTAARRTVRQENSNGVLPVISANIVDALVVRLAGIEPARCYHRGILSPLRLPVSSQPHHCWQAPNSFTPTLFRQCYCSGMESAFVLRLASQKQIACVCPRDAEAGF